ncbi:MAG: acyltransferase [Erysipelotrichaceae bacterium]|nr:acyltransferase [Erysipelotrichaceae bacterium]
MKYREFNFNSISKSRSFLMGLAALKVVAYHSGIGFHLKDGGGISHVLYILGYEAYVIKSIGQIGVDIFLFVSAIGLYYSLRKNSDVSSFYQRRFKRILPEYLIVFLIWLLLFQREGILSVLKKITGITFLTEGYLDNWYFVLLFFLYLVYPFHFSLKEKYGKKADMAAIAVSLVISFVVSRIAPVLFEHTEIAFRRLPVFFAGSLIADDVYQKRTISAVYLLILVPVLFLSFRYFAAEGNEGTVFYRYVGSIVAICLVFLFSYVYALPEKHGVFGKLIDAFGAYSLEAYLLYEKVLTVLIGAFGREHDVAIALIGFAICLLLSWGLKKLTAFLK